MRTPSAFTLPLLLVACVGVLQHPTRPVATVVAAERAFSARAQQVNVRDAFVEHFAPSAIAFTPEPGPAFPGLTEGPPWGVHIAWGPVDAGASCDGALGWTTGNADYRRAPDGPIFRRGYYSSVWIRDAQGAWKVLVDLGTGIPLDSAREAEWSKPAPQAKCPPLTTRAGSAYLRQIDDELAARADTDAVAAFGARLHPAVRLHRTGAAPVIGADAVRRALADHPRLRQASDRVVNAGSADLGYSYGRGTWLDAAGEQRFVYLFIWEQTDAGWLLRLIVQDAITPPAG
jgi:hypothetical protein